MDELISKSQLKVAKANSLFVRYLYDIVDWNQRMISISGARGVGKTTLLLQTIKSNYRFQQNALYVSMDDLFFSGKTLYETAKEWSQQGGKSLFLDEVHKYANWSVELKLIYDDLEDLQVVFTSSSILEINKGQADLSRRVVKHTLHELSFREFVLLQYKVELPKTSLENILKNHNETALEINQQTKPLMLWKHYVKVGAYPYFMEGESVYYNKVRETINLLIDVDMSVTENYDFATLVSIKKLLGLVATSVPFSPNISKLAERMGTSRNLTLKALDSLQKARMTNSVYSVGSGMSSLSKPEKLYLNNTTLIYALANENISSGNIRESVFVNQVGSMHQINTSKTADFLVDEKYTFEIGGKNKSNRQIASETNAFVVKDDIEIGQKNTVPLWMFGLLY